ncbi:TPA: hypothetical protein QC181_005999 [Bacillus cereus]|nr:hypothetical protein [Bacillus cereus]
MWQTMKLTQKEKDENLKISYETIEEDRYLEERLKRQMCKKCYYYKVKIIRVPTTTYTCPNCNETHEHPDSSIPTYCMECAKKENSCIECFSHVESSQEDI